MSQDTNGVIKCHGFDVEGSQNCLFVGQRRIIIRRDFGWNKINILNLLKLVLIIAGFHACCGDYVFLLFVSKKEKKANNTWENDAHIT